MTKRIVVATFYALHLLPVAVVLELDWRYAFWVLPCAVLATAARWLWQAPSVWRRATCLVVNAFVAFANVLLMISLRIQGVGFNKQFFYHVDWETLVVAESALAPLFFGCCAWWLLTSAWPLLLPRAADVPRRAGVAAGVMVIGVALNAPVLSLGWFVVTDILAARQTLFVPKGARLEAAVQTPAERPNLVLIYAEALEETYSNPQVFGRDLTPRLNSLAARGLRFTNMRQVSYTGWTTGGMVAAQCGLPLGSNAHRDSLIDRFNFDASVPNAICFGDVLTAYGYEAVYMGGARLAFAGKGGFLAAHGFGERHGLATLKPKLPDPAYVNPWGLYDDSLFALAHERLSELVAGDAPFVLNLLTLDTHSPAGYPSASCGPPGPDAGAEFVVECSDRLLAAFIETIRRDHPDVLVALFSDHLVPFDNVTVQRLRQFEEQRRLRFAVWGPGVSARAVDRPGTHFDVAPTLFDLLGFADWTQHNLGASLLRFDSPWIGREHPYSLRVVYRPPPLRLLAGDPLTFDPGGPLIATDEVRMLATSRGLRLSAAVFTLALDDAGDAEAIGQFRHDDAFGSLSKWAAGRTVVGVSAHAAFNRRVLAADATLAYFAGDLDTKEFVAGPLNARLTIAMPGRTAAEESQEAR